MMVCIMRGRIIYGNGWHRRSESFVPAIAGTRALVEACTGVLPYYTNLKIKEERIFIHQ